MKTFEKTDIGTFIGEFKVVSGRLEVTDPCYDDGNRSVKAKNGTWHAFIKHTGDGRPEELIVVHGSHLDEQRVLRGWWGDESFYCGVDSGQVGMFDYKHFNKESCVEGTSRIDWDPKEHSEFYRAICRITLGLPTKKYHYQDVGTKKKPKRVRRYHLQCDEKGFIQAGVCKHGAVSQTNYGDGSYPAHVLRKQQRGPAYAIRVNYVAKEPWI
jgi:hypothetical protein